MRLSLNIEALFMDGMPRVFIQELTIRTVQYHSLRLKMETVLVVSPHSHGITGALITGMSATTTHFFSISPVPASFPHSTLAQVSIPVLIWVLHLVEVDCGN
jgi:hypothetical protein